MRKAWKAVWACTVVIVFILGVAILYLYFAPSMPPYSGAAAPKMTATVLKTEDNITIKLESVPELLSDGLISRYRLDIYNYTAGFLVGKLEVVEIINNETSNVTFYDKDNNHIISKGDLFVVRGDLATKMDIFLLWFWDTGGSVLEIERGVDY